MLCIARKIFTRCRMDIVRLILNSIDIEVSVLLQHYLHYLGFYVYKNDSDKIDESVDSLVDIYVISNAFFETRKTTIETIEEKKTIFILTEGWIVEEGQIKVINYQRQNQSAFLYQLIDCISEIIENTDTRAMLLKKTYGWEVYAKKVVDLYTEKELLKKSLFTRCFYAQSEFYLSGKMAYESFIKALENFGEVLWKNDYLQYVLIFAQYEANLISKMNSVKYEYDTEKMLNICNFLLERYNENEELHLLRADILFELKENWLDGGDAYADREVQHCEYAHFKYGKVCRQYHRDYKIAAYLFRQAIEKNHKYYQAWYQLGDCYERLEKYSAAIDAFKEICKILEDKYEKHLLAPLELEYLYKAFKR